MAQSQIPPSLIGTTAQILAYDYTHAELDALFMANGFPGDAPGGNKVAKCLDWLRRANRECADPLAMFGRLIAEFMDTELTKPRPWQADEGDDPREPMVRALAVEGLSYQRGGFIMGANLTAPSRALAERLKTEGVQAMEIEFNRAYHQIESDPPAALTAACAILETVCKTYLETEGLDLPSKQVLGALWNETAGHLGLNPKDLPDQDMKQVLSGLFSIATGVAALRTHAGSAHGHSNGAANARTRPYRLEPRHARLAVHAAHTMALFVLETWEARRDRSAK